MTSPRKINPNKVKMGSSNGVIAYTMSCCDTLIYHITIADMATCRYDEVTCSCDCSGTIIVWSKCFKGVQLKMATQHPITAMNVLNNQVIVGTLRGRVLFFSMSTGELIVFAHARSVTCVSVAPEAARVLTGSEDGRFIAYKLHTMTAQAFQVNIEPNIYSLIVFSSHKR
uniref:WD_REPEATS_REGION domain-containing protein n=1 Tax=Angiostrongylus cantonensis TaxID=6313 RepID=A0A0K0D7J1_ANGCA